MYANADWSAQFWGTEDSAVKATMAAIDGEGEYTVGLDFTALESGSAAGLAFAAIGINDGEKDFPNYTIELKQIRVNGEEIALTAKGYTSSDDGVVTRMNLYNEWVGEVPADARSFDGSVADVAPIVVDTSAFAAVETVEVDFVFHKHMMDKAYLMYANADWSAQYWGGGDFDTVIDGYGDYSVSLSFEDAAAGLAFAAVGIANGEKTYPGAYIRINEIRVDDVAIPFEKGYTSSDDGITTRMNIYNEWVSALPDDARSFDGDLDGASWIIVDPASFETIGCIEVDFSLLPVTDTAYLMYANADWSAQFWGTEDSAVKATVATVDGPGTYTVGLDFTETEAGEAAGLAFAAVGITTGEKTFNGYFIDIKDIKVNGESIEVGKGYTSSDDGIVTRMNIYNEWVSALPSDARRADGDLEDASWIIVNIDDFAAVKTVEVTFDFIYGAPVAKDEAAPLSEEEAAALQAADYNAYIGVQTENYVFRNSWNDTYGRDDENNPGFFERLTGWDSDNNAVDYGGSFVDAVLTAEGEYSVSLTTGEMAFGSDGFFRLLFVSTDLPSKLVKEGYVTIDNVRTKIGDAATQDYTDVDTSGDYVRIVVIDQYNRSEEPFGYNMPGADATITITFNVTGLTD